MWTYDTLSIKRHAQIAQKKSHIADFIFSLGQCIIPQKLFIYYFIRKRFVDVIVFHTGAMFENC